MAEIDKPGRKFWRAMLYDEDKMVGEIRLDEPLDEEAGEWLHWRDQYRINSDNPMMPTEAMAEFIRLGCLRVPLPSPSAPKPHKTREHLDRFQEYVLAKAALDDYMDLITIVRNGYEHERLWEHYCDVMYSRIHRHPQIKRELEDFIAKCQADDGKKVESQQVECATNQFPEATQKLQDQELEALKTRNTNDV